MRWAVHVILGLGLGVGLALGAASLWSSRSAPVEYAVDGKTATEWALALNAASHLDRKRAAEVVAAFDTDALPSLVRFLRQPDPVYAKPMQRLFSYPCSA